MSISNTFLKGMHQDMHPKHQPQDTYRWALNAVLETEEGEYGTISNELGNVLSSSSFPNSKSIVGHTITDKNEVILALFSSDNTHEIGRYNASSDTYTTLLTGSCLNFSDKYPVNILFCIRNGCEEVIYLTDNYNPHRSINLTALDSSSISNCNLIKTTKDHNFPCISLFLGEGDIGIKDGNGQLEIGLYYFSFRYLDYDLNPTDWFFTTRPVAIADEQFTYTNSTDTLNLYDGGSNVTDSPYFVSPTNKSIKLQLAQLDFTTFPYYQLAVIKRTGDAGEISSVDILFPQSIDSASDTFLYTGFSSQIQGNTTLDDILSTMLPVNLVKAQALLTNRLYIANTTSTNYDWSTFQRKASKIKTRWVKDPSTSPVDTFTRQGDYYFNFASFMEDEVYALGIVYIMEDGSLSPVFHIPGRAPDVVTGSNPIIGTAGVADDTDAWDTGTTTTYGNGTPASKTKRWQLISTATKEGTNQLRGLMGYHESITETYPDIIACDGESYWGQDWQGNDIEPGVTKIRHHRMPGPELNAPVFTTTSTHQTGVLFSNVEYPEGAVKHYFVYSDRTFERTILAKGALIPLLTSEERDDTPSWWQTILNLFGGTEDVIFSPDSLRPTAVPLTTSPTENLRSYAFICSEGILKNKIYSPTYFRLEKFLTDTEFGLGLGSNQDIDTSIPIDQYSTTIGVQTDVWNFSKSSYPTEQWNYDVSFLGNISKATYGAKFGSLLYTQTDKNVQNLSFNISPIILVLEDQIAEWVTAGTSPEDAIAFGSIKIDADPFANLYNIQYKRMGNCPHTAVSTNTLFTSYSGDTFVSRLNITDYLYDQSDVNGKNVEAYHIAFPTQDTLINYEFRHGAADPQYSYFKWNYQYADEGHKALRQHIASKYYETTDNVMELYPQNFDYNDSYSYLQSIETYFPIPFNYEFCNSCIENNPYRIYYSELDNTEESADKHRIFRPNNYKDLEGSTGAITDIFANFDELYALTTKSIYFLPTRPQQLQTDTSSIYLGTGEVLSLPPKQLKTTDTSFGGTNYFKSRTSTHYGSVYVDDVSGRPFLLTNQLNDLSNNGLRNFWQQHGPIQLTSQFLKLTNNEFPFYSTSSSVVPGYISTYDPRYKRVIIHKRDFKILPAWENTFHYEDATVDEPLDYTTPSSLWFNNFQFYYNDANSNQYSITLENTTFFQNLSFTLSYSFITNSWVSYHSYLPNYIFNTDSNYFSSINTGIYKHNQPNYQTFYDQKYSHIIDLIAETNPIEAKLATNIFYNSYSQIYDSDLQAWIPSDITYSELIGYNSNQTTGILELQLKDSPFEDDSNPTSALVSRVDNQYRINNLRDIATSNYAPIWASSWDQLQTSPFSYIDKVPNNQNIDLNKSLFESRRFRDHYFGIRFFFNPQENTKINTDIISTITANRNR